MAAKISTPRTPVLTVSARKIKDNAADWHNLMMKWETLNDNGFTTATKIVNIKIATEFKENKLEIEYDNTAFESERLLPDYNVELEVCCTELLETFKNMEKIYLKMEKLCSTTKGICDLETYHHGDNRTPLFNTWPTPYFWTPKGSWLVIFAWKTWREQEHIDVHYGNGSGLMQKVDS
ncbi:cyclin-dependent kinase 2-interacting protein isoform X4 [Pogona vitticeps]